jgi:hypothetical protein
VLLPYTAEERFPSVAAAGTSLAVLRETPEASVLLVEPEIAVITASLPLPEGVDPAARGLIGSSDGPVLWSGGAGPARMWRLQADGDAEELVLPPLAGVGGMSGYVWGDTAWLLVYTGSEGEASGGLAGLLPTSTPDTVLLLPLVVDPESARWTFPAAGCAVGLPGDARLTAVGDAAYALTLPAVSGGAGTGELVRIAL